MWLRTHRLKLPEEQVRTRGEAAAAVVRLSSALCSAAQFSWAFLSKVPLVVSVAEVMSSWSSSYRSQPFMETTFDLEGLPTAATSAASVTTATHFPGQALAGRVSGLKPQHTLSTIDCIN